MDAQPYGNVIVDADSGNTQAGPLDHRRRANQDDRGTSGQPGGQPGDPFGTAAIQRRVLDAWAASPARFREDANAEEDAARGAYRDRLVVELLQNAVDAAHTAAVPCRVLMTLTSDSDSAAEHHNGILEIANTGTGLSAAGVESLSTLRASAKRDTTALGRFGVGFAAVLAVSDTPSIVSRQPVGSWGDRNHLGGGIGWSKQSTIDAINALGEPALDTELGRRDGAVPVLRLPFPMMDAPPPPDGYDTVVRLPLRDSAAEALARSLLTGLDPTLPLLMPGLSEVTIVIDGTPATLTCGWAYPAPGVEHALLNGERWVGRVRRGVIPAGLLADRPVEERSRTGYAARAMVREGGWPDDVPRLVRAPQPTDEPLSLPVLVSVDLPLEPSRRHTVAGPLRDWLVDRLAETVVDLAVDLGSAGPAAADDPATADGLAAATPPASDTPPARHDGPTPVAPAAPDLLALIAAEPGTGNPARTTPEADVRGVFAALAGSGHPPAHSPLAALELVPTGLPVGEVDGRLRDTLSQLLPDAPMLPGGRRGSACVVCDLGPATDAVTALLACGPVTGPGDTLPDAPPDAPDGGGSVDGLLPADYAARRWRSPLALLGVQRLGTAEVVEILTELRRPPAWWARAYAALAHAPDRDALGALPVPLAVPTGEQPTGTSTSTETGTDADGARLGARMVTGPRGVLLPTPELDVTALIDSGLPLRVVHPDACVGAARGILRTLGAVDGTPVSVLRDPSIADAVADLDPDVAADAVRALATAVLALVRDAGLDPAGAVGELPWLADLLLPDADGDFSPAGELLIADGPLDRVLATDAPFSVLADDFARAWPIRVLEAVGVLRTFATLRADGIRLDPDEPTLLELDDSDAWVEELTTRLTAGAAHEPRHAAPAAPPTLTTFRAVRDLELVDTSRWPEALSELAQPPLREAVMHSERISQPNRPVGAGADVDTSYTRWWLSRHALLPVAGSTAVLPPAELALPGADPLLDGLFAPAAPLPGVDVDLLRRLGCRLTLADVLDDSDALLDLLDRLGDTDRDVPWPAARTLYMAAVEATKIPDNTDKTDSDDTDSNGGDRPTGIDPPLTVRTPDGVVRTSNAVIVDAPDLLPLLGTGRSALRMPLDRAAEASLVLGVRLLS
ncbi:sacsin N-terminal ATP-binding-like domain-containing protein, partial [Frankia sp. CIT1]|uniref:sacsin N-terminal ATP-binding-like domain-containing protein n=1 Tax=Frankia sp. CIT1 TaxID=2880974 RepID=UPI001EF5A4E5